MNDAYILDRNLLSRQACHFRSLASRYTRIAIDGRSSDRRQDARTKERNNDAAGASTSLTKHISANVDAYRYPDRFKLERAAHSGVRSCSRFMHHVLLHLYADINIFLLKVLYTSNGKFDANHYAAGIYYY